MDFLVLLFGLALLVWAILLLRQGGLLAGSLVVLLAGICFGHPYFNISVGPLPVTLDRILLAGLFALTIVWRACGWTQPLRWTRADVALVALFGVLAASMATHDWHIYKSLPLANLLFLYCLPLALYWIARQVPVSERAITGMFVALAVFGVYLAVTAIAETHQWWFLVWPRYIGSPEFVEFLGRGRGPLLNPAGSGILQGLCLSATLLLWPRLSRRGQFLLLALLPLLAWGIYCTLTRSAWLGAALGMLVILGLTLPRSWRLPVVASCLLLAVPSAALLWDHLLVFKRDKSLSAEEAAESARLRPILAAVAWNMFRDRPLLGCGFGQYRVESLQYLSDRSTDLPLEKARPYVQHNALLALLAETGLVGMGLFATALGLWLRAAWRLWHERGRRWPIASAGCCFWRSSASGFPTRCFRTC